MKKKFLSTPIMLVYAGLFFLVLGVIEIIVWPARSSHSLVIGTIYIVGAVICNQVAVYSLPYQVSNNIKPEIIDLLDWSNSNIPQSDHPDLCAEFVKEFRKRYEAATQLDNPK